MSKDNPNEDYGLPSHLFGVPVSIDEKLVLRADKFGADKFGPATIEWAASVMEAFHQNRIYQNFINSTYEDMTMEEMLEYEKALKRLSDEAIAEERAVPLPNDHPGTHHLEIEMSQKYPQMRGEDGHQTGIQTGWQVAFYFGALSALQILGADITLSRDAQDKLARQMIDEAIFHTK